MSPELNDLLTRYMRVAAVYGWIWLFFTGLLYILFRMWQPGHERRNGWIQLSVVLVCILLASQANMCRSDYRQQKPNKTIDRQLTYVYYDINQTEETNE